MCWDPPSGDPGGDDTDQPALVAIYPRLHPQLARTIGNYAGSLAGDVLSHALDEHTPASTGSGIEMIDLKADVLVVGGEELGTDVGPEHHDEVSRR